MRLLVTSVAIVLAVALIPAGTVSAQDESASASPSASQGAPSPSAPPSAPSSDASVAPSLSAEPSGSLVSPDAVINLEPASETIPARTWAIAVSGGTADIDTLEVDDFGSSFPVTVSGQTATVTLTLTPSPELVLNAGCVDSGNEGTVGTVEAPDRLVLEVVPGGTYTCRYDTACAGPSGPPLASVFLYVSREVFDVPGPWAISVTDGRALGQVGLCGTRLISSLKLVVDPELPEWLVGGFSVEPFGESATVEITAPRSNSGAALPGAACEDQDSGGLTRDILVSPRQLVFDVAPMTFFVCYVEGKPGGAPGTVPPTDTLAYGPQRSGSGAVPIVIVLLVSVVAASLLVGVRARR